jgi:hypothetical protein
MSIGDIANEAKAILEDIRTNTLGTRNEVSQLDGTAQAGFVNLSQGMAVLIQLGQQANQLAEINDQQNATMICWLGKIAHVLCDIKHDLDSSLAVQRAAQGRLDHMDAILSLVHARESVEIAARDRLQAEIETCCPPVPPEPAPCFEDCAAPELPPFRPVRADWKPVEFPHQDPPK